MPSDERYSSASNRNEPTITRTVTKSVVPVGSKDLVDPDLLVTKKHEEWTTSKRVVNHKTKQVETRVQRQLVLEDGKIVADSGPQVTTKTKEDVRVEESENTEHKTTGDDPPGPGYTLVPGSAKVISEKTESNQTMTETKEENRQMHDERIRDLTGEEIHQRTIISPDDASFGNSFGEFPGKLTHYSSRSQKIVDKDEVKEVSEMKDGEISTETTRTHHHEEAYDDEVPEEEAEEGMVPERSAETSRTIQYYTDPKDFQNASDRLDEETKRSHIQHHNRYETELPAVTHRWVNDHFGNKEFSNDSRGESVRTRSGGNRITIEMSGHRSSPSDLSPRGSKLGKDSSLRSSDWRSPSPASNHIRSTASPFEVSSSSSSSRSKTPVKTFYLGEDNTYQRDWKKKQTSYEDYGERSDSFRRVPRNTDKYDSLYSKSSSRVKTDKNVQVSMSDDEEDSYPKRTYSPLQSHHRLSSRSTLTLPRVTKVDSSYNKSPYSSHSLTHSKHYKSSDSLNHSPSYGNYYDYGTSSNSYRIASPVYNNTSFHRESKHIDGYHRSEYSNAKTEKKNGYYTKSGNHEVYLSNGRRNKSSSPSWYSNSSSLKGRKIPISPPESGYQSPFPPTPPSSPPPRLFKSFDHYGSSSSTSPPDSPVHLANSIKKKSAYPSGSASRSKSSSDLRTAPLFAPESFSPLSSPLTLKSVGESDRQKYFRVKPGQDGHSVVVQVREWEHR